jgi:hypothetical protein
MVAVLIVTATTSTSVLLPKFGPRPLVPLGMLIAAGGMFRFSKIDSSSTYTGSVLFPLMIVGLGIGLAMAPSFNVATMGVQTSDAGAASATANTAQQIGGSIGTALLSTVAANSATAFIGRRTITPRLTAEAAIHSYATAFSWAGGIFVFGAIVCGSLLKPGAPVFDDEAAPAVHV